MRPTAEGDETQQALLSLALPVADSSSNPGWPVQQPDPDDPPYVLEPLRLKYLRCPAAMECGTLCARLPLFCFVVLLLYLLGIASVVVLLLLPVTKNGRTPSAKREDAISNSEVHLSKIGPARCEKIIRVIAAELYLAVSL